MAVRELPCNGDDFSSDAFKRLDSAKPVLRQHPLRQHPLCGDPLCCDGHHRCANTRTKKGGGHMPTPPIGAAQRMVETLSQYGVPYVFGVPGSASDAVHDALAVAGPELVMCHHEQNAVVMAAAVGLLTGTPGAVLATSRPAPPT